MVIGLLGGIGSGKSTVARLLAEAGAEVVDADVLAHQVLREPAVRERVAARFGREVLGPDGEVDRRELGRRVFSDAEALGELNGLVHPRVRERIGERIGRHREAQGGQGLLVLDVPLLIEEGKGEEARGAGTPLLEQCDALVYVEASEEVRRERVRSRGWAPEEIRRREARQAPLEEKRRLARFRVDNSGPLERTRAEVARLLEGLRSGGTTTCLPPSLPPRGRGAGQAGNVQGK